MKKVNVEAFEVKSLGSVSAYCQLGSGGEMGRVGHFEMNSNMPTIEGKVLLHLSLSSHTDRSMTLEVLI